MKFSFEHKELSGLFICIAVLILLFSAFLHWKKKVKKRIGDEQLVNVLIAGYSPRRFNLKYILLFAAFAAGIIAAMNPGQTDGVDKLQRKGIDIAVALDVSKSMLAADMPPNRLERAKQFVNRLLDERPDDRVALILFAGKAYMQMPLTTDHGAAKLFVLSAGPDAVPQQGTVLGDAMEISSRAFNPTDKRFKTIILISDGEDHDNSAVKTAKDLAEQGIMINTVGIGTTEGSVITDPVTGEKKDESGNTVVSKLNESVLKEVAAGTNGIYINLQNSSEAVVLVKRQLSQIEGKAFNDISQMNFRTFFMWFAAAMFVLLLAENFVPERKKALA
ncbi:MAG: VWA domain-containing protein [Bacteroidetes bacterium]|nr:VWA domain-containing protein [Bacteroidota bacterium]